jgi:hypothetical protein
LATEKQIAANRANAKRSTGPRTAAGKLKTSRNAYRHGLSGPVPTDPSTSTYVNLIARTVAGEQANENRLTSAAEFARVQLELLRIQAIRAEQCAKMNLNNGDIQELKRLAALDRYERYALTKHRRASQELRSKE